MNPQNSIWDNLLIPFLIGIMLICGYGVFKKNEHIMNPEPHLKYLRDSHAEVDLHIRQTIQDDVQSADASAPVSDMKSSTETAYLSHRMLVNEAATPPLVLQEGRSEMTYENGILYTWDDISLSAMNSDGTSIFKFQISSQDSILKGSPTFSNRMIFFTTVKGRILAIDKKNGHLAWYVNRKEQILWNPFYLEGKVYVFVESKEKLKAHTLVFDSLTGNFISESKALNWNLAGAPLFNKDGNIYYNTLNGQLISYNLKSTKETWSNELASSYKSAPTLSGDRIYTLSEDGVVFGFDKIKGKKMVEFDLGTTSHMPIHINELLGIGALIDVSGYLVAFDIKSAKKLWKYNVYGTNLDYFIASFRLMTKTFEQLGVQSQSRGWSIWAKCSGTRLCLFEPKTGMLLHRVEVKDTVVGTPLWTDSSETLWVPALGSDKKRSIKALKPWKQIQKIESQVPENTSPKTS